MPPVPANPSDAAPVLLVQLSDSHLFAEPDGRLLGMDTADSLSQVVRLVRDEQTDIGLVLATGDLSQDGSLESYQRFRDITAPIAAPIRWFPGNHDELDSMRAAAAGTDLLDPVIDLGAWRVILLDSTISGAVPGQVTDDQVALLERAIEDAPSKHLLISFHHHPVPIGSLWMDRIGIYNPEKLFAVLDRYPNVRCLLWGHVHQEIDRMRGDVRLLASPSTCVQFTPGSEDFCVDSPAPGYRWLRLYPDGLLETGVSRVTGIDFEVDYSVKGY
ncbi:3',5'-cyclic-AMP phosphodiesterase [Pseudomonas sp. ZM23]|uniref:3',5'-cyclic-AMP phosphodiesterase n=1 Tax=Pseudomonas triclosanedens TaxID=2961893 RepID=A0ABY6ZW19_9PSED|nr:3',5'-cyclic-AMP phosphodiesterase [Pseudomonas triclosanedens]MCP8465129.1 3',5'-cyclic-AMP phosphodiesterase [Pseudomonas triclosanedens]MCP8470931.1 3',5'-cyclic-AMP phosphodiesterase [Pseudomonas triclosanedens]MCP8476429.1 3',5'-cyclic-AMP phosphodiesterase [Pseudomonas triclosanedens]WAI49114.1 3',5'-cyclic-AMP phosphodiesterase [Pseudomonas triclosanedens]